MYYIIISGASRGLGRSIALEFSKSISATCLFSLGSSSRSTEQLEALKNEMLATREERHTYFNLVNEDFGDTTQLNRITDRFVLDVSSVSALSTNNENVTHVIYVSNVGSLGYLNTVENLDLSHIQNAYDLNITSSTYIVAQILQKYKPQKEIKIHLINISSLAAVQPFSNWSLYCAGKAARDMFFQVIAEENSNTDNNIRVLNYAPGPLDTDMQREIRSSSSYQDKDTQSVFVKMKADGTLVDPKESASKV